jgi:peptidoglycan/xylan/chitin deacetylase (PgdA/CDA1 family)
MKKELLLNIEGIKRDKIQWPDNKKFGLCLTHDVDRVKKTYQCVTHFLRDRRFYHFKSILENPNPYWTFDTIIELEEKYGVRSTFFFLNESKKHNYFRPSTYKITFGRYDILNPKIVDIIKRLDEGGWEIGLHGSYDSFNDIALLQKEKTTLEKILKKPILGTRQHYLHLNIPQTWEIQRDIGLSYDSSYGYLDKVGYRGNFYNPFRPFNDKFLVIPLTIMDGALFKSGVNFDDAWSQCMNIFDIAEKMGGLVTIVWHIIEFNENEFPGQKALYEKIIKECLNRNAYVGSCRDIYNLFQSRRETL